MHALIVTIPGSSYMTQCGDCTTTLWAGCVILGSQLLGLMSQVQKTCFTITIDLSMAPTQACNIHLYTAYNIR